MSSAGYYVVRSLDWDRASTLEEFVSEHPAGIVLERKEPEVRGVLLGHPAHLPLDPILGHRTLAAAERCLYNTDHGRRLPT